MTDAIDEASALRADGRPFVLATVVWRRAPTSGHVGAKAIVLPDGTVHGFVGGACAATTLVRQALDALTTGEARLLFLGPPDQFDGALREGVVRVPMACESEGALEIYLEPVLPAPHVLVIGDSALTTTLAALTKDLGWSGEVVDDVDALPGLRADARTAVVVATQGRYDEAATQAALASDAGYVGLIASRRRAVAVDGWLRDSGVEEATMARLHSPAGLDLGAVDHREIAVAVLAELVALRVAGGLRAAVDPVISEMVEARDVVCGMTVTVAGALHVSSWGGRSYYFCAASCKRSFEENPEKYAAAMQP